MFDFITVGGTTRDISFFTDKGILMGSGKNIFKEKLLAFESGSKIKVDKFYYSYGGGAANSAACLVNFGFKIACLAPVGTDRNGQLIVENLKARKIDTRLIQKVSNQESGFSFILIDPNGERIIFQQRGANINLAIGEKDVESLRKTKNIYIASLAGDWSGNLRKIFSVVDGKKSPTIFWNPGMTQLLGGADKIKRYLKRTTVLACNEDEALALILNTEGYKRTNNKVFKNVESLIHVIHSFGPKVVVITRGSKGVMVYDGKKLVSHGVLGGKKQVDTTGVGDIFNSSFAAGWILFKGDIDKTIHLSLQNVATKISHVGAQNSLLKIT